MPDKPLKKLSPKHLMFCEFYLTHFNASRAAREAGCSPQSARAQGCYFLGDVLVKEQIQKRTLEIMSEIHQSQVRVFRELCNLAFSDIRDLYNTDGSLKQLDEWPDEISKAVASVKQTTRHLKGGSVEKTLEVRLWDKTKALENLARVVGLLSSDLNVNLPDNSGAIYFPAPKPAGDPVDPVVVARDKHLQLKLHPGGKSEDEKNMTEFEGE